MYRTKCICSNVVTAATRKGHLTSPLTEALEQLSFKELLFAAESLAKTRVEDRNLWNKICDRLRPEIRSTDLTSVLRVVHAMAKVPYAKISFLIAVERALLDRHVETDTRTVTQYFIDACRLGHVETNTFQAVIRARINALKEFSPFDLCFLLHVTAKLRLKDHGVIEPISMEIWGSKENYEALVKDVALVAMVIRALAMLQSTNTLFNKLIKEIVPQQIDQLSPQELCNVIFALVVAFQDIEYTPHVANLLRELLDRVKSQMDQLLNIEINQLCISLYHLRQKLVPFDERFADMLEAITVLDLKFKPSTSKMQYKLAPLLNHLKLQHRAEVQIGPYVMDYVIPRLNVAVEVNGHSHFYHQSTQFHALTKLKYSIVQSLGWQVLSVNYFDWKNKNRQSKLEYLAEQLQAIVDTNMSST